MPYITGEHVAVLIYIEYNINDKWCYTVYVCITRALFLSHTRFCRHRFHKRIRAKEKKPHRHYTFDRFEEYLEHSGYII